MGLKAGIWASWLGFGPLRLEFRPQDWDLRGRDGGGGGGEGENLPYAIILS